MSTTTKARPYTRLTGVTYGAYVRMRDHPGNNRLRMAYHDGVLEIMSPAYRHDCGARHFVLLVLAYCKAFGLACEGAGSTTFRKGEPDEPKGKGKEADESFFLGAAARAMVGKEEHDLATDPPPSLWIEIDNRGSSKAKLPLYAGLGVPEVWRYRPRSRQLWFGRLAGETYEEIAVSVELPGLTPGDVLGALAEARTRDWVSWFRWLDEVWFPEHRQELTARGAGGRR
jgi:Uma2 family endonuclease